MIDVGETPREAAVRELREETGYIGSSLGFLQSGPDASIPVFSSSGLTNERVVFVRLGVDDKHRTAVDFQESEDITTHHVQWGGLSDFIQDSVSCGSALSARVYAFLVGRKYLQWHGAKEQ